MGTFKSLSKDADDLDHIESYQPNRICEECSATEIGTCDCAYQEAYDLWECQLKDSL